MSKIKTNTLENVAGTTSIPVDNIAKKDEVVAKSGDTMTGQLKGITPVDAEDLTRKDYVDGISIGIGQTWQDMTSQRALVTEYTNDTNRPITVSVICSMAQVDRHIDILLYVDNMLINFISHRGSYTSKFTATEIIPANSIYKVSSSNIDDLSLFRWFELR
jgi:hypothetical protein